MKADRGGRVRWLFVAAGLYGLAAVAPLYLRAPDADGSAAFFRIAFAGAAGATQWLYLMIGMNFRRYRPLIWVGVASKLSFALPCLWLIAHARLERSMGVFAAIDLLLAAAFVAAWALTRQRA